MVELKSISNEKRELIVRDLVYHPSPIPSMKTQFPKRAFPSLNFSRFFIKSFVLFSSQTFCFPSHSLISSSSTYCANTHFDFHILFKNHLSQSVRHSFYEVGLLSTSSNFISPFSHITHSCILHGLSEFNAILFDDCCRYIFYPSGTSNLVVVSLKQPS